MASHPFTKSMIDANRNRFVTAQNENGWAVYRIGHKGGVRMLFEVNSRDDAVSLCIRFNDMWELGEIL